MHNGWLPREGTTPALRTVCPREGQANHPHLGLTSDPIGRFLKKTALNPAFTLGLLLLARYTKKGNDLSILHETAFSRLRKLFYLGCIRWASGFLDIAVLNNWTTDKYEWDKEIVLITGGAGGIGGGIVRLLAEKGIKVVVLDVIPMTFETRTYSSIPR
jgi:all-trans-retinol dehydrogenase (NAD+)